MLGIFKIMALWLASMAWHLSHIAIGRPQYKRLSDTSITLSSFAFIMAFAALLRWGFLDAPEGGPGAIAPILVALVAYATMLAVLTIASTRSKTLFAALLGVSAVMDFIICAFFLLGVRETVRLPFGWLYEVLAMGWTAWRFFQEPPEVQSAGYRRHSIYANE